MDTREIDDHRRLNSRTESRLAFDAAIADAHQRLRVFDQDGRFWGFERKDFADLLAGLLRQAPTIRVILVLHDASFVERECPRLLDLLRAFAPRIQVLGTEPGIRSVGHGMAIIDDTILLRRPSFEQPVCFADHDDKAIAAAGTLFEEVLGHASPVVNGSVTGL